MRIDSQIMRTRVRIGNVLVAEFRRQRPPGRHEEARAGAQLEIEIKRLPHVTVGNIRGGQTSAGLQERHETPARLHKVVATPQRNSGNKAAWPMEDRAAKPLANKLEIAAQAPFPFHIAQHVPNLDLGNRIIDRGPVQRRQERREKRSARERALELPPRK